MTSFIRSTRALGTPELLTPESTTSASATAESPEPESPLSAEAPSRSPQPTPSGPSASRLAVEPRDAERSTPKWATRRVRDDAAEPGRAGSLDSPASDDAYVALRWKLHEQLMRELDLPRLQAKHGPDLRKAIEESVALLLLDERVLLGRAEQLRLVREVADEVVGLGPLELLLDDPSISEIMVNGPRRIFVERDGRVAPTNVVFRDNAHLMRIIERIVSRLGRHVDEASPMVDARLADGSRVNAVIPPLAVQGPSLTIRKFARVPLTAERLVEVGSLTPAAVAFLKASVEGRTNLLISGGTGSGKTTLLSVLGSFIPAHERVVTIEDPCELQLAQPNLVQLETRPPNIEGKGEISQRQLVKNALRMRPDRIVVGEVRGGEAFDMLQAMNTGHEGSLTTIHANTPRDGLLRVENMILMAGFDLPVSVIREQIASGIHLLVHVNRLTDGTRRVVQITEVHGLSSEGYLTQDIFAFDYDGVDSDGRVRGQLRPTGNRPRFLPRLAAQGVVVPDDIFDPIS